jgi:hypothetical protein
LGEGDFEGEADGLGEGDLDTVGEGDGCTGDDT